MSLEDKLAELTRKEIERHTEWDSLHHLLVILRDGPDSIRVDTMAAIDPAFDPAFYPVIIEAITREVAGKHSTPVQGGCELEFSVKDGS